MEKVNVIIPTYNGARFISRAVLSVINQTYTNVEIIIVDDGSTDNTQVIVEDFQKQFIGRIRYIYQKNNGPSEARNNGLRAADGKYVAFLDSDDQWLPTKLERQVVLLENDPKLGFVYCDANFVNGEGVLLKDYVRKIALHKGNITLNLFMDFFIITSTLILKRACLEKIGYFDSSLIVGEDYEFMLRLAKNFSGDVVVEKLINRVVRPDSLSRLDYAMDARNDLGTLKLFIQKSPDFYQENKDKIHQRLADYHFTFGYQLLENGRNKEAFINFLTILKYQFSLKAIKNIFLCLIPHQMRLSLKGKKK